MVSDNKIDSTKAKDEVIVRVEGVSEKFCRDLKWSLWCEVKDNLAELFLGVECAFRVCGGYYAKS